MSKVKKLILDNSQLEEEFFEEVAIIGIVSALDYHTFIWTINLYLAIDFKKNHELEIEANSIYYPLFTYTEILNHTEHYIYTNRNKTNFLLPEAKNVDYLWMIKTPYNKKSLVEQYLILLQKIKTIDYSFEIQPHAIKNKQALII